MEFTATWEGIQAFKDALNEAEKNIDKASAAALLELGALAESKAKGGFSGSHARGQPHTGGPQPNVVTGNLRRSITRTAVQRTGPGEYMTRVYPSTVYARAVELGNPRTGARAFPYFGPAMKVVRANANDILIRAWSKYI
jgi:hypothetical protein